MPKASAISVRVSDEMKEAVDRAASDDGRSTSAYVTRALAALMQEKGYMPIPRRQPKGG